MNFMYRFYVNVSFYFSGTNAQEYNCSVYGICLFIFLNCQTIFQSDCYHIPTSDV